MDWLTQLCCISFVGYLAVAAWAFTHQSNPFWSGFVDGMTFRHIWQRRQ